MTITRSFGMVIEGGVARYWYAGADGVRRWAIGDKPVDDFISAMSAGIPPITTPDPIAADEEEHESVEGLFAGSELSDSQMEVAHQTQERG